MSLDQSAILFTNSYSPSTGPRPASSMPTQHGSDRVISGICDLILQFLLLSRSKSLKSMMKSIHTQTKILYKIFPANYFLRRSRSLSDVRRISSDGTRFYEKFEREYFVTRETYQTKWLSTFKTVRTFPLKTCTKLNEKLSCFARNTILVLLKLRCMI